MPSRLYALAPSRTASDSIHRRAYLGEIPGVMMLVLFLRVVSLFLLVAQVVQHPALPQQAASVDQRWQRECAEASKALLRYHAKL